MKPAVSPESDSDGSPEDLTERVVHAAEEIVDVLRHADEGTRHELLHRVEDELSPEGVHVLDTHNPAGYTRAIPEFDPDALPGVPGKRTGRTRAKILADLAFMHTIPKRRRRL